jgi:hypothetical protein
MGTREPLRCCDWGIRTPRGHRMERRARHLRVTQARSESAFSRITAARRSAPGAGSRHSPERAHISRISLLSSRSQVRILPPPLDPRCGRQQRPVFSQSLRAPAEAAGRSRLGDRCAAAHHEKYGGDGHGDSASGSPSHAPNVPHGRWSIVGAAVRQAEAPVDVRREPASKSKTSTAAMMTAVRNWPVRPTIPYQTSDQRTPSANPSRQPGSSLSPRCAARP